MIHPETPPIVGPHRKPRQGYLFLSILLGCGLFVGTMLILGAFFVAREMIDQAAGQGFRVDPSALQAYQAAQKIRPGAHLFLKGYYPPGSMMYVNAGLSTRYDPKEHVKIKTGGVTLVIENGVFQHRYSRPLVLHDGKGDPTKGYSVKFRSGGEW